MSTTGLSDQSVLVVGGGQAGFQTSSSLRDHGFTGRVVLVGNKHLPYQRPPLSKAYLHGQLNRDQLTFRPQDFFDRHRIEVVRRGPVTRLDLHDRTAVIDHGERLTYDHVVLATGCRARRPDIPGKDLRGIHYLRDVEDAELLTNHLSRSQSVVVVGAGFIGLEVAAAARKCGLDVTVVELAAQAMGRSVSRLTGEHFVARHRAAGTRIQLGTGVREFLDDGTGAVAGLLTSTGEELRAAMVVVGVGVLPNTELAERAGLTVDDGIVVDGQLRSVDDGSVSAVGDCCRFVEPGSGASVRLESVQNAVDQARCVAKRLAGTPTPYRAVPWFWTDQLDLKLQIAGLTNGHDQTVVSGDPAECTFSVYCFADDRLLGVESVNRPADHLAARRLLAAEGPQRDSLTPAAVASSGFSLRDHLTA